MKQKIRNKMLELRKNMDDSDKTRQEESLYCQLFSHEKWKQSERIAVTISVGNELNTYPIIYQAWKQNKEVAAPVVNKLTKQLEFYLFHSFDQCRKASYGLLEPVPASTQFCGSDNLGLIVTPGLAFDKKGYRVGYGGGYYDKLLAGTDSYSVSLSYDFQLLETVPIERFDEPVCEVFTS